MARLEHSRSTVRDVLCTVTENVYRVTVLSYFPAGERPRKTPFSYCAFE